MAEEPKLENFISAFDSCGGGCRRQCNCGVQYYHHDMNGYDWEQGEFDELTNNLKAVGLDWSVGTLWFNGKEYVIDCHCWREDASKIMKFLDAYNRQIAEYLTREKARKQKEAEESPVVV